MARARRAPFFLANLEVFDFRSSITRSGIKIAVTGPQASSRLPGIDAAKFQEIANAVKRDCPVSQALASVPEITLKAKLR